VLAPPVIEPLEPEPDGGAELSVEVVGGPESIDEAAESEPDELEPP
jgi:hypothetical protein